MSGKARSLRAPQSRTDLRSSGEVRRRLDRMRVGGEAGFTLIDLLVAMTIMSVVMAVFTVGLLQMYSATNTTVNVATTQSEINRMYLRLDRSIRYATAISADPTGVATTDGNWYVQYLTNNVSPALCQQLRLNLTDKTLQYRQWESGTTIPLSADWQTLVSNIYYDPAGRPDAKPKPLPATQKPFTVETLGTMQRLRLDIWTIIPDTTAAAQTSVTFTAQNSTVTNAGATAATCAENRPS